MSVEQALSETMSRLGPTLDLLQVTEFGERDAWVLGLDEKTVVQAEYDRENGRLMFFAEVGPLPAANREKTMASLLNYNAMWREHGGVRFALDAETQVALFMLDMAVERVELATLCRVLPNLREMIAAWREAFASAASAPQGGQDPLDVMGMIRI